MHAASDYQHFEEFSSSDVEWSNQFRCKRENGLLFYAYATCYCCTFLDRFSWCTAKPFDSEIMLLRLSKYLSFIPPRVSGFRWRFALLTKLKMAQLQFENYG